MSSVGGKYDKVKEALLFSKCLGINDSVALRTHKTNPDTGETELLDCLNVTTTPDGAIETVAPFVTAFTHSAPITGISAGKRFIYTDALSTSEWNGTDHAAIGALLLGHIAHTPLDVRLATTTKVYKGSVAGAALTEAVLGTTTDIPATSKTYAGQPPFTKSFVYNGFLYGVNKADPRFLQYSEYAHYDVWNIADNFIGHRDAIIDAGAIVSEKAGQTGGIICLHADGVSVYDGANPGDFSQKFFPCSPIAGTLYSGFVSKAYGYAHIFLCDDGIYTIDPDGNVVNLTVSTFQHVSGLNSSYTGAIVAGGKYLAFGNSVCVEYDFRTKTAMKRAPDGVTGAAIWNDTPYFATGSTVATLASAAGEGSLAASSVTLPYSDFGVSGAKSLSDLYFTGTATDDLLITATADNGTIWEITEPAPGSVYNHRIKTPRILLGNHLSLKLETDSGAFRLETLRATFTPSYRSR